MSREEVAPLVIRELVHNQVKPLVVTMVMVMTMTINRSSISFISSVSHLPP
jgi:hypothetical protein